MTEARPTRRLRESNNQIRTITVENDICTENDCNLEADSYPTYRTPITGKCAAHAKGKTPKWTVQVTKAELQEIADGTIPQRIAARAVKILEIA